TASIGPTAVMPAVGIMCPSCRQANHPKVAACVFCGARIAPGTTLVAVRGALSDSTADSGDDRPSLDGEMPGAPIADPLIGMIVAERYRIIEPLGRGGMGIVYKVEHTRIGKLLAMKLLTGELSRNPEVVRRFKQEALTVSKLDSANTVQVFDYGATETLTYLVMELVSGEDLGR